MLGSGGDGLRSTTTNTITTTTNNNKNNNSNNRRNKNRKTKIHIRNDNAAAASSPGSKSNKRKSICNSSYPPRIITDIHPNKRPPPPPLQNSPASHSHHPTTTNSSSSSPKGGDSSRGRDDVLSNSGAKAEASPLPDKHILQLIIDVLQRRDTYEIFAEPVDPNEVEDYYQIVKEPMDFGTMRAKLHEGMYHNLDQFKHDVFLITRNAMHFNSSATIYFRQARAIHELAKRVFHVLINAPQNFELKFSGTRGRSTRRTPTLNKPSAVTSFVSPKGTTSSIGTSIFGNNVRGSPWIAGLTVQTKRSYRGLFPGARDDQKSSHVETDHRCTYRSTNYPCGHDNDLFVEKCIPSNPLVPTNTQDTNYRKSLLLFVKDLGPTAQMIATQKIRGGHENIPSSGTAKATGWGFQTPECEVPDAVCGFSLRGSFHLDDPGITASHNITGSLHGCCRRSTVPKTTPNMNVLSNVGGGGEADSSKKRMNSGGGAPGEDTMSYAKGMRFRSAADRENEKVMQNERSTEFLIGSGSCDVSAKSAGVVVGDAAGGKLDENVRAVPVVLALEHSHSHANANVSNASNEWKWRNKKSCRASAGWVAQSGASSSQVDRDDMDSFPLEHDPRVGCCSSAAETQKLQTLESSENKKIPKLEEERVSSPFTFTLGFLKAQLNQMNVGGGGKGWTETSQAEPESEWKGMVSGPMDLGLKHS